MRNCDTGQGSAICFPASFNNARNRCTCAIPAAASSVNSTFTSSSWAQAENFE